MARKFQHKRGLKENLPKLSPAEMALTTDEKKLYFGDGNENIRLLDQKDKTEITTQLSETIFDVSLNNANPLSTDNTSTFQDALNKYRHIKISKPGTYITKGLVMKSNTTLELAEGVTLKLKDNTSQYIIVNENWRSSTAFDYNIKISGGKIDINGANNPRTGNIIDGLYAGIGIVMHRVKNLEIRNIKEIGNGLKYCMLLANIENGTFENINCINQSDGLHFQAPCKNIKVHNLTGSCHDNLLPFTIGDYPAIVLSEDGDFDNIDIKNIYSAGETIDIIRFVGDGKSGTGRFRNISIDNVQASCPNTGVIEVFNNDQATPNVYLNKTIIENIRVSNIRNNSATKRNLINVWGSIYQLTLSNLYKDDAIGGTMISVFNSASVENIIIENSYIRNDNGSYTLIRNEQTKNVNSVTLKDSKVDIKGTLIEFNSNLEHKLTLMNTNIYTKKLANIQGAGTLFLRLVKSDIDVSRSTNVTDPLTLGTNAKIYLDSIGSTYKPNFKFSGGLGARINAPDITCDILFTQIIPTNGDIVKISNVALNTIVPGTYLRKSNNWVLLHGEFTKIVQALDFGVIPANSSVVRDVSVTEFGDNLSLDYKYASFVNAYNGAGESNNLTYCSWLKNGTVKIRVSNVSNTEITVKCDWLVKIVK